MTVNLLLLYFFNFIINLEIKWLLINNEQRERKKGSIMRREKKIKIKLMSGNEG